MSNLINVGDKVVLNGARLGHNGICLAYTEGFNIGVEGTGFICPYSHNSDEAVAFYYGLERGERVAEGEQEESDD